MDFDSAISAHVQWKLKIEDYLRQPDHTLSTATASSDQDCELGKWLHGDAEKHSDLPWFSALITEHARFHKVAGEIVRRADAGESVSAEVALGANSEFARSSIAVIGDLMHLKLQAQIAEGCRCTGQEEHRPLRHGSMTDKFLLLVPEL